MTYKITDKRIEFKDGPNYAIWVYGRFWLPVSKETFEALEIGDTVALDVRKVPHA